MLTFRSSRTHVTSSACLGIAAEVRIVDSRGLTPTIKKIIFSFQESRSPVTVGWNEAGPPAPSGKTNLNIFIHAEYRLNEYIYMLNEYI